MRAVTSALARAVPLLFDARVLASVGLPLLAAIVVWIGLVATAVGPLGELIARAFGVVEGASSVGAWLLSAGANALAFALLTAGVAVIALATIAALAGGIFVRVVARQYFPDLERRHGGTWRGSLVNALVTLLIWLVLAIVALPLWLLPPLGLIVGLLINAWLNQRLFRYDALAEHATASERAYVIRRARGRLYLLGLLLAPLAFVPIVNLLLPLYAGLAFTVLCLSELAALRERVARGQTTSPG